MYISLDAKIEYLLKSISLLTREKQLAKTTEYSVADITKVVEIVRPGKTSRLGNKELDMLTALQDLVLLYSNNVDHYDVEGLATKVSVILNDKRAVADAFTASLRAVLSTEAITQHVVAIRNQFKTLLKEYAISQEIAKAYFAINDSKQGDNSILGIGTNLAIKLDGITSARTDAIDPAIMDTFTIGEKDSKLNDIMNRAKDVMTGTSRMKFGWNELNIMTQGGILRGETAMVYALQHKFKTGFTLSTFMQLAMYNDPKELMDDPDKKPMNVLISFEDDAEKILAFMYKYLFVNEYRRIPDISSTTTEEMTAYIESRLAINGYATKIIRVNPDLWTYKDIFNTILELESQGYEIHAMYIDYLAKLPTTGCHIGGAAGTDLKNLLNKVRNFCVSKRIAFLTPHQLSSDAKQLLRNGISDQTFVKEVVNKGYSEVSKSLDQINDLEIYLHLASINKKWYLTVQRGKHRTPKIISADKQFFMLPFEFSDEPVLLETVSKAGENLPPEQIIGALMANNSFEFDIAA